MRYNLKRLGEFFINKSFLEDYPEQTMQVFKKCIIVQAQYDYASDAIKYVALCDEFQEIDRGMIPPVYRWVYGPYGSCWCS